MKAGNSVNALDLEKASLVDKTDFLRIGQAVGIELLHYSPFIHEWISGSGAKPAKDSEKGSR